MHYRLAAVNHDLVGTTRNQAVKDPDCLGKQGLQQKKVFWGSRKDFCSQLAVQSKRIKTAKSMFKMDFLGLFYEDYIIQVLNDIIRTPLWT